MDGETSKIIEILKEKTNSKNYSELAEKLGMTSSSLSLAKSRGSVGLLLEAAYSFSLKNNIDLFQYILSGEANDSIERMVSEDSFSGSIVEKAKENVDNMTNAIFTQVYKTAKENGTLGDLRKLLIDFSDTLKIQC